MYCYKINRADRCIWITPQGVSVEFSDGTVLALEVVPEEMFPGCNALDNSQKAQLEQVADMGKGTWFTALEMEAFYQEWLAEGSPQKPSIKENYIMQGKLEILKRGGLPIGWQNQMERISGITVTGPVPGGITFTATGEGIKKVNEAFGDLFHISKTKRYNAKDN